VMTEAMSEQRVTARWMPWVLAAMAVFVLSFELGARRLSSPDETRYAAISWSMLETGDWLTPVHNFKFKHWQKPPLTYWLMASSFAVLGQNDWAARVPSALAALAAVMGVYVTGRTMHGPRMGFSAGLVLLANPLFFVLARLANADMLLCAFVTWSWVGFVQFLFGEKRRTVWFLLGAAFAGLGFMTKGPVVLMSTFAPMLLTALLTNQWKRIGWWRPLAALGVFLVVALPWYVIVCIKNPGLLGYFVEYQTVERITTNIHERAQPFWFFFFFVPLSFLPWTVLPFFGAWASLRRGTTQASERARVLLLLSWFGVVFVFITFSTSKMLTYCLPLFPALALIAGRFVARAMNEEPHARAVGLGLACGAAALLTMALLFRAYSADNPTPAPLWWVTVVAVFALPALVLALLRWSRLAFGLLVVGALFPLLAGSRLVVGREDEYFIGNSGKELAALIRPREHTARYRSVAVVLYRRYLMELPYYLGHPLMCLDCHIERFYERPDGTKVWFYTKAERDALYDGYYRENGRNQLQMMMRLGKRRLLVVTDKESYRDISRAFTKGGKPLVHFIGEVGNFVLCSNHPDEPAEDKPTADEVSSGEE
jgi:4-amino-4-deoxy-L-arabinose transferase-like glycosyltransferase